MFCIFIHFEEGYAPRNPPLQNMGHIPQDSEGAPIVLLQLVMLPSFDFVFLCRSAKYKQVDFVFLLRTSAIFKQA